MTNNIYSESRNVTFHFLHTTVPPHKQLYFGAILSLLLMLTFKIKLIFYYYIAKLGIRREQYSNINFYAIEM